MSDSNEAPAPAGEAVELEKTIERILRDSCELPDRNSPEDQPEMLLITVEELDMILRRHLGLEDAALHPAPAARDAAGMTEAEVEAACRAICPDWELIHGARRNIELARMRVALKSAAAARLERHLAPLATPPAPGATEGA